MTILILSFLFGVVIGSFLNVCIYRIPKKISIVSPPSSCTKCGYRLGVFDLIPLLSYLWLKGRCRRCGEQISWRYPAVELLTGLLFVIAVYKFGISLLALKLIVFGCLVITISFIDLELKIIPNVLSLPGMVLGLLFSVQDIWNSILGLVIGFGIIFLVALLCPGGMGMGDAKLLGMIGAFFGWKVALGTLFLGSLYGSVIGIALLVLRKIERKTPIPFGPYLCLGALTLLFAEPVMKLFPW